MSALPKKDQKYTYTEYKKWDLNEGERFELIYGEAFAMSAPNARHQEILMEIAGQFHAYLKGKPCKVYPAPFDVRLFYREDGYDDTVVQPDITIVCDEKKRGHEGCRGAPDLVIEILSPTNTAIEMERKLRLYQDAGVQEYWIVDPENKSINVYRFKISSIESQETRNTEAQDKKLAGAILSYTYEKDASVPVGIFPDLQISMEQVFAE